MKEPTDAQIFGHMAPKEDFCGKCGGDVEPVESVDFLWLKITHRHRVQYERFEIMIEELVSARCVRIEEASPDDGEHRGRVG